MDRGKRPFTYRGGFRGRKSFGNKRGSTFTTTKTRVSKPVVPPSSASSQPESFNTEVLTTGFINVKAQPLVSLDRNCPFPGWLLYFPTQAYETQSKASLYTKALMEYITETLEHSGYNPYADQLTQPPRRSSETSPVDWLRVEAQGAVLIDYPSLLRSQLLERRIPDLRRILSDPKDSGALRAQQCELVLNSFGLALHSICYNVVYKTEEKTDFFKVDRDDTVSDYRLPSYIAARIINHSPVTPLRKLRAYHLGQFISVKGIVVRLGPVEPICHRLAFECCQCGTKQILVLPTDGRYFTPNRCPAQNCRSRSFEPLLNHPDTVTVDTQMITVQEASGHESDGSTEDIDGSTSSMGRSPRCLSCRLKRDLVDSCLPGDVIYVTGCVGLLSADGLSAGSHSGTPSWCSRRGPTMFTLMLNVNSLVRVSGGGGGMVHPRQPTTHTNGVGDSAGLLVITSPEEQSTGTDVGACATDLGNVMSSLDSDFSIKDLYAIREISEQPNLFRLLVASLCPNICGRGIVKAGLLLALFGGTQPHQRKKPKRRSGHGLCDRKRPSSSPSGCCAKTAECSPCSDADAEISYRLGGAVPIPDAEDIERDTSSDSESEPVDRNTQTPAEFLSSAGDFGPLKRSASHVLIVGDPGLGKSQMLRAAANLAPRVIYVCGNTATAAGLTVSTIRESGSGNGGGFGLEAGALVLADQGCCCIDEFDKLACDPAVLLEAMEQQTISVARGGLVANLPARAAVLAAANPVGGHYDCTRRLDENLRIAPALLSRFDLIYVLLDRPDEAADRLLSEHVTAVHTGNWKPASFTCTQTSPRASGLSGGSTEPVIEIDPSTPLAERLELRLGERVDFIPPVLLRKYILYARKYVMPNLSESAASTLRDFYLELRRNRHSRDTFPITMRQLESLVRLTEARARAELREEATRQDALDACELMRATGLGTGHVGGTPANATLSQIARMLPPNSRRSTSATGPAAAKRLLSALEMASQRTNSRLFTRNEVQTLADGLGFSPTATDALLDRLNEAGAVLKQGASLYKLL